MTMIGRFYYHKSVMILTEWFKCNFFLPVGRAFDKRTGNMERKYLLESTRNLIEVVHPPVVYYYKSVMILTE